MATDIASLSIKVENGDVVKATSSLNTMAVAGGKTEAATQRLTRRIALLEIEARQMDADLQRGGKAMLAMEIEARKLDAELGREARAMALVEIEARKMDAAMTAAKQAAFAAQVRKTAEANAELAMRARQAAAEVDGVGKKSLSIASLRNAFAALGIGLAIREVSQLSDAYTNLRSRLSLVTTGTANLNAVQEALFQTSQKTRSSFEATVELYGRVARNAGALGASQADLLKVTETISKSMVISGTSADSARAAMIQLGQAFASGTLRGDELNSVLEQAPRLAQTIADGLGVTVGQLRKMGEEGKLTSKAVFDAIKKMGDSVTAEFERMPRTISGAMQQMRNEVLKTLGSSGEVAGATGGIVTALDAIRNAIGPTARALNAFFGGFSIAATDAALSLEKLRQKTAEWQMGIGLALSAKGQKTIGDALIGNAAKVMKDGDDITRMLEKQRDVTIEIVHAIAEAGKVSTVAPPTIKPPDPKALEAYKKLMEELRDVVNDVARAQLDAQIAGAKASADASANIQDELTQSDLLLQAAQQGVDAYKAQQREIEVLNALTRAGITLADEDYEAKKRAVEQTIANRDATQDILDAEKKAQDEAQRDMERRAKELHRTISGTIEGIFTDVTNKRNPFVAIFDNLKRGAIKAISDLLATKIEGKFGKQIEDLLGITTPASKQEKAGKDMKEAADKMLKAAELMNGGPSSVAGITIDGGGKQSAGMAQYLQKFLKVGGAAVGGFELGSGIGQATGSKTLGVAGGAVSGFMLGNSLLPGLGGAVGAVAGAIGGFIGAAGAAAEAARRLESARKMFKAALDDFAATVSGDDLGRAIAQAHAQAEALRQQLHDTTTVSDLIDARRRGEYFETLKKINALEAEYIANLKAEAAAKKQQAQDDLDVRTLRNQGKTHEADVLQKQKEDAREYAQAVKDGFSDAYLVQLKWNQKTEEAAVAAGKAADAMNALTTSVRGGPSGFKLNGYIQQYGAGLPHPAMPQSPLPWPTLPPGGLTPPSSPTFSSSSTGKVATAPVTVERVEVNLNVSGVQDPVAIGKLATKAFLAELDKTVAATGGLNTTRAVALNKMTVS